VKSINWSSEGAGGASSAANAATKDEKSASRMLNKRHKQTLKRKLAP
jgi:shikimate 5-dehydrogenase